MLRAFDHISMEKVCYIFLIIIIIIILLLLLWQNAQYYCMSCPFIAGVGLVGCAVQLNDSNIT